MLNLDKNKKYLLACSYGPDSMALFNMLLKGGYSFAVAHVNYNLREESSIEESNLVKYCNEHNIQLYVHSVEKGIITKNLEAQCREIRYQFFKDLFEEHNYDAVLVAHHQDDHIETYLLQKQRKNKVSFYGLPYQREMFEMLVIRPLLELSKNDILAYCEANNVPYSIDKTNELDIYERNKIRHKIVYKLTKEERAQILEEIKKNNEKIQDLHTFLQKIDLNSVKEMTSLNNELFAYALHEDLYSVLSYKEEKVSISQEFADEIKKALLSDNSNISIRVTDSLSYIKSYDRCYFLINSICSDYEYVIEKPCTLDTPYFYLNFLADTSNRNVTLDDYPLIVRNARKGDRFQIKDYHVSVRRAFIDWKMPYDLRASWPVIVNKKGIVIYVPRYKNKFLVTPDLNFYVKPH